MLWEEGWGLGCGMFCSKCLYHSLDDLLLPIPEPFSLPAPIPQWPSGSGFASGMIGLGELEVFQISKFEFIWGYNLFTEKKQGVSFYKPVGVPHGFFTLGYYCQSIEDPLRGFVLVAREVSCCNPSNSPGLLSPLDYVLVWSSYNWSDENLDSCGYFWLPQPPSGYKALGFVVTTKPEKPNLEEVKCIRADLTDECDVYNTLVNNSSISSFGVWSTRPKNRGMLGRGVSSGMFFCSSSWSKGQELSVACLKNLSCTLHAMPNLDQIHALVRNYGPTVFFHPEETYLPSSVSWFFRNGALLYKKGDEEPIGCSIDEEGSNLPAGGTNDGEYWIDLPSDSRRENIKRGNIESAKLYVHVKPALGGTFTDIVMWVFCPFNGPGTLKIGMMNIALSKVGQHIGDWEHFTLRISNFTGELWGVYFSQHSGGEWCDIFNLEFIRGNKAIIYSSKHGHSSYPHPGLYLQGSSKLGVGVRNDAACSDFFVDSSSKYEIVAAEYLGNGVVIEPNWLQYMREWGPKTVYDSRAELDRVLNILPLMVQNYAKKAFCKLPAELFREEGPTGPKEKNNWVGDERC